MKKIIIVFIFILSLLTAAGCFAAEYEANGIKLTIPEEYDELLVVKTETDGNLFSLYEKESLETAEASGHAVDGVGWLFSIGTVTEKEAHEMLCGDMSGEYIFAAAEDGTRYVYYHPTDVRFFRDKYTEETMQNWRKLNEWAAGARDKFVTENGLKAEKHGNSDIDILFAKMMYKNDIIYTISTTEFGPQQTEGIEAYPYIKPLTENVEYLYSDEEAPDGEYVVLNFPEENLRYDFFFADGNYIRRISNDDQYEIIYKAEFEDKNMKIADIMNNFYHDVVAMNEAGNGGDDLAGTWADNIAGRCSIRIEKTAKKGQYNVEIHWSSSAFETNFWTMTAEKTGNGSELRYTDGKLVKQTYPIDGDMSEVIVYENGTGSFYIGENNLLHWNDETEHTADRMSFAIIKF